MHHQRTESILHDLIPRLQAHALKQDQPLATAAAEVTQLIARQHHRRRHIPQQDQENPPIIVAQQHQQHRQMLNHMIRLWIANE